MRWVQSSGVRVLLLALALPAAAIATTSAQGPEPRGARDFFNLGADQLSKGKLREAETHFETALARQEERWRPPALYNLGHVRFEQGVQELEKGPNGGAATARGKTAAAIAGSAVDNASLALQENNVQKMVAAYVRGRGARRELRAAMKAVRQALESHGAALNRWQRSSADFRSVLEIRKDPDAEHNAAAVDREIAKLIDRMRELQQAGAAMKKMSEELNEKMKQMKGRIPEPDMPPGAPGDDEEEEDEGDRDPQKPPPGAEEKPSTEGEEMMLSPEQASWLLENFKLDTDRRLPMGQRESSPPKDRNRGTW